MILTLLLKYIVRTQTGLFHLERVHTLAGRGSRTLNAVQVGRTLCVALQQTVRSATPHQLLRLFTYG
jgi:hypothetical protein